MAWLLGHDPTRRVIVVSYSNDFAAELHRQFRMVIDASWYQALFPGMRPAKDTGTELVTTAGGSRNCVTFELVADCGSDEIGTVRVEPFLHH